jgi:hypothetical protein
VNSEGPRAWGIYTSNTVAWRNAFFFSLKYWNFGARRFSYIRSCVGHKVAAMRAEEGNRRYWNGAILPAESVETIIHSSHVGRHLGVCEACTA